MVKINNGDISIIAKEIGLDPAYLKAIIVVESGGDGFNTDGKIVIQFEPHWFKKLCNKSEYSRYIALAVRATKPLDSVDTEYLARWNTVLGNKVEGQVGEWKAFNAAWKIDEKASMLSTSWGLMQTMGFNHVACGYSTVNAMVDDYKKGELQQLQGACKFIQSNKIMYKAAKDKDSDAFAYRWNGPQYKKFNYAQRINDAYIKAKKIFSS